jgi:hypothetical protein
MARSEVVEKSDCSMIETKCKKNICLAAEIMRLISSVQNPEEGSSVGGDSFWVASRINSLEHQHNGGGTGNIFSWEGSIS